MSSTWCIAYVAASPLRAQAQVKSLPAGKLHIIPSRQPNYQLEQGTYLGVRIEKVLSCCCVVSLDNLQWVHPCSGYDTSLNSSQVLSRGEARAVPSTTGP